MNKPQYAVPPNSNNGTGAVSSAAVSSVEQVGIGDPQINKDTLPRLERRICPDLSSMDIKNIPLRELVEYCLKEEDEGAWSEFDQRVRPTIRGVVAKRLRFYGVKFKNEL